MRAQKCFSIPIKDDTLDDDSESVTVSIAGQSDTFTITDNDEATVASYAFSGTAVGATFNEEDAPSPTGNTSNQNDLIITVTLPTADVAGIMESGGISTIPFAMSSGQTDDLILHVARESVTSNALPEEATDATPMDFFRDF